MPDNFRPFVTTPTDNAEAAHLHTEGSDVSPELSADTPLSTSFNDLGQVSLYDAGHSWEVALIPEPGGFPRIMRIRKDIRQATLWLKEDDPHYDFVMDSMTRIFFSQYVAGCGGLMLHASVVELNGKGFIFMGESGIGKSTHSRLWIDTFNDCRLLNDDCPVVMPDGSGRFMVAGTPWSGKTHCFRNAAYEVGGIARLRQSPVNSFMTLDGIDAFISFIPGMSVMTSASGLYDQATHTALQLLSSVTFGLMKCLPDKEAAALCFHSLSHCRK